MSGGAPTDIQPPGARSNDVAGGCQDELTEHMRAQISFSIQRMVQEAHAHRRKQGARGKEQSVEAWDLPSRALRERVRRFCIFAQAHAELEGEPAGRETIHAQLEEMRSARSRELREMLMSERCYGVSEPAAGAASPHVPDEVGSQTVNAGSQQMMLPPPTTLPKSARTLIVRSMPMTYSQEDLLAEWPPDGSYDYLCIPYNVSKGSTHGIAFVNFVTYEHAALFHKKWHGAFLSRQDGKHPLDIAVAKVQGYAPNLARIKKSEARMLAEAGFLPVLVDGKRRMEAHEVIAEWRRACSMSGSGACRRRFQ